MFKLSKDMGGDGEQLIENVAYLPSPGRGQVTFDLFRLFGEAGGRERFEAFVSDTVGVTHPTARGICAVPGLGDWGMDTVVGSLDSESVMVWQSKFFIDGCGKNQQGEIRASFDELIKRSKSEGFSVATWTLVIPVEMDIVNTKWWDGTRSKAGWKKRKENENPGLVIGLWDLGRLRRVIQSDEFESVRRDYFGRSGETSSIDVRPLQELQDENDFINALFVSQLEAAGLTLHSEARKAFFNAELLRRDIADREVTHEVKELTLLRSALHGMWEDRYNSHCATIPAEDNALPNLYSDVMTAIENSFASVPSRRLGESVVHRKGVVHQISDDGKLGWIRDFQRIVSEYRQKGEANDV